MLQIYFGIMVRVAKLFDLLRVDKLRIDNTILPLPPLKELQIFIVLRLIMKINLVLLDALAG